MPSTIDLLSTNCQHALAALAPAAWPEWLALVPGWQLISADEQAQPASIEARFDFQDFDQTMAFANAVAAIAKAQDHHPDMHISYKHCGLRFTTHSAGSLTVNDFICAARVNALRHVGGTSA
ncbi:MAG: 4a-hydroxytetrahydrobiopterin dehydratase [Burkholderiaceae bacterium]|uniref:4a-hydroxytetrahydrobiopterin dehydratase n=1 Tax=Paucibacter sp. KCTC 42545 TaxID=1768242 RepID=UPI000733B586|nr:4a-hydroxytetrahydrobiopterin dehydratase [Paucibacter sp. KCTC 42545]ALT77626.1 hypothetical protein AT984_10955 [Paucibacter sp. KCTC 42545]MBY0233977.1 4a-hydroxytetrahydrobiopterin dehydratase [Burkholderiaceae bacterium]